MKKIFFLLLIGSLHYSLLAQHNKLTRKEKKEGWQLLFDGKSTKGWHTFNKPTIGSAWKIKDSALVLDASEKENWQIRNGGDIVYETDYTNFHLKIEWKVAKNANSGIMFFVKEDPKYKYPWETGIEMQVLDNNGHPDAKINKHRAGDLYDIIAAKPETAKPAEEWNAAEIICKDGKLEFWLNGIKVVETTLWTDEWRKMVAASKFKAMPDYGTLQTGKISLQDHGDVVAFRNIKIKKL